MLFQWILLASADFVQGRKAAWEEQVDPVDDQSRRDDPGVEEDRPEVVLDGSWIFQVEDRQVLDDHDRGCQH